MQVSYSSNSPSLKCLVVFINEGSKLDKDLDKTLKGAISQTIKSSGFKGKKGEHISTILPGKTKRLVLLGCGKEKPTEFTAQLMGARLASMACCLKEKEISVAFNDKADDMANIAYGVLLRDYNFEKYKSKKTAFSIKKIELLAAKKEECKKLYSNLQKIAESVHFARDMVNEPPNIMYPETLAKECKTLSKLGVKVEVLGEKQLQKLKMGAMLGVGMGSQKESKLVVMQYNGGKKGDRPIAMCGKGVTFDTGGISLKTSTGMEKMKYDMSGSAVVVGALRALAARGAKVNIVVVVGYVENMIGSHAQRPSDVVTSMSGQTIEVLNTDAEGRLLLADVLWYCQDRFKPKMMIDFATLTSGILFAVGSVYAGLFSNDQKLTSKFMKAGEEVGEKLWQLPIDDDYDRMMDSDIADVKNISQNREAPSSCAAVFLKRFINKVPWVHIDIASIAWATKSEKLHPKGPTVFGIRLLNKFIDNYIKD